jgi:hypothetical protein
VLVIGGRTDGVGVSGDKDGVDDSAGFVEELMPSRAVVAGLYDITIESEMKEKGVVLPDLGVGFGGQQREQRQQQQRIEQDRMARSG